MGSSDSIDKIVNELKARLGTAVADEKSARDARLKTLLGDEMASVNWNEAVFDAAQGKYSKIEAPEPVKAKLRAAGLL